MRRAPSTAKAKTSGSRMWAMALSALGVAGLLAVGIVYSGLSTASRVAANAEELHWANAMLGSAEIARLTVGQAVMVAEATTASPGEGGDREEAMAEARLTLSVAADWSRRAQPPVEVEGAIVRALAAGHDTLVAIERGDLPEARRLVAGELADATASVVARLDDVQERAADSIRATETTANQFGTWLQFLVVLGLPGIALLVYRRRARRDLRRSKGVMRAALLAEQERSRERQAALADSARRIQKPVAALEVLLRRTSGDPTLPPSQRQAIADAHSTSLRARRVLDDTAVAAAFDAGELDSRLEDFPLDDELRTVVDDARREGIDIDLSDSKVWVRFDRVALRHILTNLIDNAANHGGNEIQVGIGILANHVTVGIRDNGPGIPPTIRERYFSTSARPVDDILLAAGAHGIPVALALAVAMDGDLQYQRTGDGWSSFELRLPVAFPGLDQDEYAPVADVAG